MLSVQALRKSYHKKEVIRGISFTLREKGITGFLGVNGAGKTTLLRMASGYLAPDKGNLSICGYDIQKNRQQALERLGYLPEGNPLYEDMRIIEFLTFRACLKRPRWEKIDIQETIEANLESCGLISVQNQIIHTLSKGFKQRVGLADALLGDPKLLILDEPMVGLDPQQIGLIRQLLKEKSRQISIFLSSHILHELEELCDDILIIHRGSLVKKIDQDMNEAKVQSESFEVEVVGRFSSQEEFIKDLYEQGFDVEKCQKQREDLFELSIKTLREENLESVRKRFFDRMVSQSLKIIRMSPKTCSLEELFLDSMSSSESDEGEVV